MYGLRMTKFVVGRMSLARAVAKMRCCGSVSAVVRLVDGMVVVAR